MWPRREQDCRAGNLTPHTPHAAGKLALYSISLKCMILNVT